ncbi:LytR C-terminal domain-containing protein, partial [Patescibacteria group bacterium]|nr:LytR C-terminal domain-containing protein [Patescibacteria group bacterium]
WGLGEIDGNSEELVLQSLGEGLGLWLQVAVKVEDGVSMDGLLDRLLSLKGIKGLSWLDRYTLYKDLSGLSSKGIVLETNLPYQVMDRVQDVDGYEWLELNEAVFVWSRDLWPNEGVVNLGIKVEVVNASDTPGVARVRARQLESIGFRVVSVKAGDIKIDEPCVVKVSPDIWDKNQFIKQILKNYLGCEVEMGDGLVFFVG